MKKGVVLLNMGGPNSLEEVETFLSNMFNDRHILNIPMGFVRRMVASFIVMKRKEEAKNNYRAIGEKSPLPQLTQQLIRKLRERYPEAYFGAAMRYVPPRAEMVVQELMGNGVQEVILFPMYPHYSDTTTASSIEDLQAVMQTHGFRPKTKIIERYHSHPRYNQAVFERIREGLAGQNPSEYTLVFSAHGLPQRVIDRGDPYQQEIEANVTTQKKMLAEQGIGFESIHLAYQSKVGPLKWIGPSLEEKLQELGGKKVLIYPIAFTVDNSETDFELSIEYKEKSAAWDLRDYRVCRCLNDSDLFVQAIGEICALENL